VGGPVEASTVKSTGRTLLSWCVAKAGHAIVGAATQVGATESQRACLISSFASYEQGDEQAFKRRSAVRDPFTHATSRRHSQSVRIPRRPASRQAARLIPQNHEGPKRSRRLHASGSDPGQGSGAATAGRLNDRSGVSARRHTGLSDAHDTVRKDTVDDGFARQHRLAGDQETLRLAVTPVGW
jgi:hypothetical protein